MPGKGLVINLSFTYIYSICPVHIVYIYIPSGTGLLVHVWFSVLAGAC